MCLKGFLKLKTLCSTYSDAELVSRVGIPGIIGGAEFENSLLAVTLRPQFDDLAGCVDIIF